jgi:protein-tyrosine-phosphatase
MRQVIVFVCEHGAAKSVVAAAWLGRLAADARVPLEAVARGTEPDPEVSPIAVAGLSADGLPVPLRAPQRVVPGELRWASRVVSFGPDLGGLAPGSRSRRGRSRRSATTTTLHGTRSSR